jgi:hypothetical protein
MDNGGEKVSKKNPTAQEKFYYSTGTKKSPKPKPNKN